MNVDNVAMYSESFNQAKAYIENFKAKNEEDL